MKTSAQILGEAIVKDRVNAGKSQEDVAKEVGVTQQALSGWEAGTSMPRTARIEKLYALFGPESQTANAVKEVLPRRVFISHNGEPTFVKTLEDRILFSSHDYMASQMGMSNRPDGMVRESEDGTPKYTVKEEKTVMLPSGGSRNNAPAARFDPEALSAQEVRDALSRAADDVRFARQALDRTAEQIQRALSKLPKY